MHDMHFFADLTFQTHDPTQSTDNWGLWFNSFEIVENTGPVTTMLPSYAQICRCLANSARGHSGYRALDLRLEIAGSILVAALSSATLGKVVHTHLPLPPSSMIRGVNRHTVQLTGPVSNRLAGGHSVRRTGTIFHQGDQGQK